MATGPSWWELVVCAFIALVAVAWLLRSVRSAGTAALIIGSLALPAIAIGSIALWTTQVGARARSHAELVRAIPDLEQRDEGFVTSNRCQACHPSQYHTWHDSYHRTMTQAVGPETVLADWDGVELHSNGRTYHLERRGDEFWANVIDPEWELAQLAQRVDPDTIPNPPRVDRRIVMSTGSHAMQTYWLGSAHDGGFHNLPFIWLNEEERWVPREDAFLRPPDLMRRRPQWHTNCIECHSTGREWDLDAKPGQHDPEVAELGIACEACHGPAEEHIRVNQDPTRRLRLHASGEPDPTIVNPARLTAERSSMVCGQCHGINVMRGKMIADGHRYRAGDNLRMTRFVVRTSDENMVAEEKAGWPYLKAHLDRQTPDFIPSRMWPDGMVRVSGREHNAMTESACYQGQEMSCLSCHSMHQSDPADQLAAGMGTDQACLQCHAEIAATPGGIEAHTHHPAGSVSCYDCHMPHTTYGLMKAIRSHLVDAPTVEAELATGRPNACSLCHLDRPLSWVAERLTSWYDQPPPAALTPTQERIASGVRWALTGDANQRALAAWHFGFEPAQEASGVDWMAPYLGHLLDDPYSTVRAIAERSLRTIPGASPASYDYVGPADARRAAATWVRSAWRDRHRTRGVPRPALLLREDGTLDDGVFDRLSTLRDDRPVDLRE